MCTGVIPFYAESAVGVLMRRLTEEVKPPRAVRPDIDPKVEAVILKAMHRDRGERYQTIRELRAALRDLRGMRGSMLPGPAGLGAGKILTPETAAATMALGTPVSIPSQPVITPTRLGEVEAAPVAAAGPSTPVATPKPRSPARWFIAGGAAIVVAAVGGFALMQSSASVDAGAVALTTAPVAVTTEPALTAAPETAMPATTAPEPATAAEEEEATEGGHRTRRPRDRDPEVAATAAPATAAPATTAAPAPATNRPATAAPATSRPATAAAPTGPLEARASISGLSVDGGLSSGVVRSAIERVSNRFESCYADAARRANKNQAGTVNVRLTIDEGGRASGVSARGDPLPGLSTCVRTAAQRISARAPDTGTVDASFGVQFTPRR
jgi:serine/threonine-protein kinase